MRSNVGFQVLLSVAAMLGVSASSCSSSGPAGVYADILWQVRCQVMGMCTQPAERSILGFDREDGQRISCNVIETAEARTLSFNASFTSATDSYGISMTNARFPRTGGTPAVGCTLTVQEGNTYVGACGGSPPSEAQPCQVSNVVFTRDAEGRSLISGNIYCVGISPPAAPNIDREITAPGPTHGMDPLTFNLYDCNGYHPD